MTTGAFAVKGVRVHQTPHRDHESELLAHARYGFGGGAAVGSGVGTAALSLTESVRAAIAAATPRGSVGSSVAGGPVTAGETGPAETVSGGGASPDRMVANNGEAVGTATRS